MTLADDVAKSLVDAMVEEFRARAYYDLFLSGVAMPADDMYMALAVLRGDYLRQLAGLLAKAKALEELIHESRD